MYAPCSRETVAMRDISFVLQLARDASFRAVFSALDLPHFFTVLLHDALEKKQIAFPVEKKENKPTLFLVSSLLP